MTFWSCLSTVAEIKTDQGDYEESLQPTYIQRPICVCGVFLVMSEDVYIATI